MQGSFHMMDDLLFPSELDLHFKTFSHKYIQPSLLSLCSQIIKHLLLFLLETTIFFFLIRLLTCCGHVGL